MNHSIGKYIILFGIIILVIGIIIYFLGDKMSWLGKLPGDIRIERENTRIYFPITTMILISIVLTLVINILKKIF